MQQAWNYKDIKINIIPLSCSPVSIKTQCYHSTALIERETEQILVPEGLCISHATKEQQEQ